MECLQIKRLYDNAILPTRATEESAGADLYACLHEPITIEVGEICPIPLGISGCMAQRGTVQLIFPRSGLSTKHGITLANSVGVIDNDYRGEWIVPLQNFGKESFTVEHGMRVAQLLVVPIVYPTIQEVATLSETQRGAGGFGSSGK